MAGDGGKAHLYKKLHAIAEPRTGRGSRNRELLAGCRGSEAGADKGASGSGDVLWQFAKPCRMFQAREAQELATYTRIVELDEEPQPTYELGEIGIYDLLDIYRQTLVRRDKGRPMEVEVRHLRLSEVIREILTRWLPRGVTRIFRALLPVNFPLHQAVMTFLAVLEL